MHAVITHNLMLLLERGAFGQSADGETLLPMSPHKWRKLVMAAKELNLLRYVAAGARESEAEADVSPVLFEALAAQGDGKQEVPFDSSTAHLFNHWTQKRLESVREEEMNAHDTSDETLILLDIIIKNAEYIVTKDTSIDGIVTLGRYIREHKNGIDYNKLQHWLADIGLVQIASMEGNMLISCMHLSQDEMPFVIKPYRKARRLFMNSVEKVFQKHSFSNMTRMNVAMLETISHRFVTAISMVTDIEE